MESPTMRIISLTVNGKTVIGEPTHEERLQQAVDLAWGDLMCGCPAGVEQHFADALARLEPLISDEAM